MSEQTPALDTRIYIVDYLISNDMLRQIVYDRLRPIGVHMDGSVFLVPGRLLPRDFLDVVRENPGTRRLHYTEVTMSGADIKARLAEDLNDYAIGRHTALIRSLDDAAEKLRKATEAIDAALDDGAAVKAAAKKYEKTARAALERASKYLQLAIDAAMAFDETENLEHITDGLKALVESRKASVKATMDAYAATLAVA
jgi:hypothetical protein